MAAQLVANTGKPFIIWCHLNPEGDLLEKLIPDAIQISGADSDEEKEEKFNAFTLQQARVFITKRKIGAWGMNWQHCARMAFIGPTFSYEKFYQAVRRCHRFGQKRAVTAHVVMAQTEVPIWDVLTRKSNDHESMAIEMFAATRRASARFDDRAKPYEPTVARPLASWIYTRAA